MSLGKRLQNKNTEVRRKVVKARSADAELQRKWAELKTRLHGDVLDKVDIKTYESEETDTFRVQLQPSVAAIVTRDGEGQKLTEGEQKQLVKEILDEITGFGPLEILMNDPDVSDILINRYDQTYVERSGRVELSEVKFNSNKHLLTIIQRIVGRVGRRVDESSPMVDARLPDGSRFNAIIPPLAVDGPCISIRRFGKGRLGPQDLIDGGACTPQMMHFLKCAVASKTNMVVSGGTGSGKTTLLNLLSGFIPEHERLITAEDATELNLAQEHVVRLESKAANIEGTGAIPIRELVKNALRMRPDRVIIGEVRGAEVLDMLQAMNTGHEGSMATVHANSPKEAGGRLMMMCALAGMNLSGGAMAQFIADSVAMIVQTKRFPDGKRRITNIAETRGADGERILVEDIFSCDVQMNQGKSSGTFHYHDNSKLLAQFDSAGFPFRPRWKAA